MSLTIEIAGEEIKFAPPRDGEMHPADKKQIQRLRKLVGRTESLVFLTRFLRLTEQISGLGLSDN